MSNINYRPEIDGLRALAVIPVILLHAGIEFISGGFIGVDVFFVISGFLITTIIWREIQNKNFSIADFYRRRARRILPALLVMLLVTSVLAFLVMLPGQFHSFVESVMAALAFIANIFFGLTLDYFSPDSSEIPMLHLWSLGVEEQFYIFFPLILMLFICRSRKHLIGTLVVLAIISLGLAEFGWRFFPQFSFYLLPTRAWELLAGAIVALLMPEINQLAKRNGAWLAEIASLIGLTLIVLSLFLLDKHDPTPSVLLLPSIIGASLILGFANKNTFCGKILSFQPICFIGLMSYSAYLWHQPIIALAKIQTYISLEGKTDVLTTIFLSLLFGYLSWRYIERPFRTPSKNSRTLTVSFLAMIGLASLVIPLNFLVASNPKSLPTYERAIQKAGSEVTNFVFGSNIKGACNVTGSDIKNCHLGIGDKSPEIILWGDSYAGAFYKGLNTEMKLRGIKGEAYYIPGCPPIVGLSLSKSKSCTADIHNEILQLIVSRPERSIVLLYGNLRGATLDAGVLIDGLQTNAAIVGRRLTETRKILNKAGKKLVIVEQGPRFSKHAAKFYYKNRMAGHDKELILLREKLVNKHKPMMPLINSADYYIKTVNFFCGTSKCSSIDKEGNLLFSDNDHLTPRNAELLAKFVIDKLDNENAFKNMEHGFK